MFITTKENQLWFQDSKGNLIQELSMWKLKQVQDVDGQFVALTYYNGTLIGLKTKTASSLANILSYFTTFLKNRKPEFKLVKFVVCPPEKAREATVDFAQIYKKSYIQLLKPTMFGKEHPPYLDQMMIYRYEPRNNNRVEKVKKLVCRRKSVDIFKNLDLNQIIREQVTKGLMGTPAPGEPGVASDKGLTNGSPKPWDSPAAPVEAPRPPQASQASQTPPTPPTPQPPTPTSTPESQEEQNGLKQSEIVENFEKQAPETGVPASKSASEAVPPTPEPQERAAPTNASEEISASKGLVIPPESPFPRTRPSIFKSMLDFKDKIVEPSKEPGVFGSLWGKIKAKTSDDVTPIAEVPSTVEPEEVAEPDRKLLLDTVAIPKKNRKVSFFEPDIVEQVRNEYKVREEGDAEEQPPADPNEYRVDPNQVPAEDPKAENNYQVGVNSLIGNPNEYSIS